jgi:hypothetical protein
MKITSEFDADKKAWSIGHTGHIAGTLGSGSRDDPINQKGNNPGVARNWSAIVAATRTLRGRAQVNTSVGDVIVAIVLGTGAIGAAIALL